MKRNISVLLLVLCSSILFSACTPTVRLTDRNYEERIFGIDFRRYNEMGFLFYTEEYYGAYEVLGLLEVEIYPEVKYKTGRVVEEKPEAPRTDDIYQTPIPTRLELPEPQDGYSYQVIRIGGQIFTQNIQNMDIYELIDQMYNLSVEWGGDAITHFRAYQKTDQTDNYVNTSYPYYSVSGLVIKRK